MKATQFDNIDLLAIQQVESALDIPKGVEFDVLHPQVKATILNHACKTTGGRGIDGELMSSIMLDYDAVHNLL